MKKRNKATTINQRLYGKNGCSLPQLLVYLWGRYPPFFLKESYLCNRCSFSKPLVTLYPPPLAVSFLRISIRVFGEKNASRGNNLVIEQGNGGEEDIPLRLIPLTLFGTITTHLFGGSVGREGTAVQMGAQSQML